jgi:hypothetical protein
LSGSERKHYWLAPPEHLNYWNSASLKTFLHKAGFSVKNMISDFPMEVFMLLGDDYITCPESGRALHLKRVAFERNFGNAGKNDVKLKLYEALAGCGLVRMIQAIAAVK